MPKLRLLKTAVPHRNALINKVMNFAQAPRLREAPLGQNNVEFRSLQLKSSSRRGHLARINGKLHTIHAISEAYSPENQYKLRQVKLQDVPQAATICFEAFGAKSTARLRTLDQWERQITAAIAGKRAAHREARIQRLVYKSESLRTQLAALDDPIAINSNLPDSPQARAILQRRLRRRSFYCFIAEDRNTSQVVGCVALTLAKPEAVLPPPFPTSARIRCYVSNVAVAPEHRRRGVASFLIGKCERVAKLWGQGSLWLHVDPGNDPAELLYRGLGYQEVNWLGGPISWVLPGTKPVLMTK